jgi:hypothetical protein
MNEEQLHKLENYRRWNESSRQARQAYETRPGYLPPLVEWCACTERCKFWDACNGMVWQGVALPCQPQSEPDLVNAREVGDYANAWKGESTATLLPRIHANRNTQVER